MPTQTEIQMVDVDSENLQAVGYDSKARVLRIKFHASPVPYDYEHVPPVVHKMLMEAESKGQFFMENIKGEFKFRRVAA